MTDPNILDPEIAALCDDASAFVSELTAALRGAWQVMAAIGRLAGVWADQLRVRVYTEYLPAELRRAVAHRSYSLGLPPPRRSTLADRVAAEVDAWGMRSGGLES